MFCLQIGDQTAQQIRFDKDKNIIHHNEKLDKGCLNKDYAVNSAF